MSCKNLKVKKVFGSLTLGYLAAEYTFSSCADLMQKCSHTQIRGIKTARVLETPASSHFPPPHSPTSPMPPSPHSFLFILLPGFSPTVSLSAT